MQRSWSEQGMGTEYVCTQATIKSTFPHGKSTNPKFKNPLQCPVLYAQGRIHMIFPGYNVSHNSPCASAGRTFVDISCKHLTFNSGWTPLDSLTSPHSVTSSSMASIPATGLRRGVSQPLEFRTTTFAYSRSFGCGSCSCTATPALYMNLNK